MKKLTKLKSSAYAPTTTNLVGQDIVYMNMSQHYRQVLNAKSRVDTSAPSTYRGHPIVLQRSRPHALKPASNIDGLTPSDLLLIEEVSQAVPPSNQSTKFWDRIQKCDSLSHKSRCPGKALCPGKSGCAARARGAESKHQRSLSGGKKTKDHGQDKGSKHAPIKSCKVPAAATDITERHLQCFGPTKPFAPLILKTTASSRLRISDSYHPPRSKSKLSERDKPWAETQVIDLVQCDGVTKPCRFNDQWLPGKGEQRQKSNPTGPSSKVSTGSCDSAYNGGTSSAAESRGPTPEQAPIAGPPSDRCTPVNCVARNNGRKAVAMAAAAAVVVAAAAAAGRCSPADCRARSGGHNAAVVRCTTPSCPPSCPRVKTPKNTKKNNNPFSIDDLLYASFSHAITAEILKLGIYTDKGINTIIHRHMEHNKYRLNMDKLKMEANVIRTQLGIPIEQDKEETQKPLPLAERLEGQVIPRRSVSTSLSKLSLSSGQCIGTKSDGSNNNLLRSDGSKSAPAQCVQPSDPASPPAHCPTSSDLPDQSDKPKGVTTISGQVQGDIASCGELNEPGALVDKVEHSLEASNKVAEVNGSSKKLEELDTSSANINVRTESDLLIEQQDTLISESLKGIRSSSEDILNNSRPGSSDETRRPTSVKVLEPFASDSSADDAVFSDKEQQKTNPVKGGTPANIPGVANLVSDAEVSTATHARVPHVSIKSDSLSSLSKKRFTDTSSEVKPSTITMETQTDVTAI